MPLIKEEMVKKEKMVRMKPEETLVPDVAEFSKLAAQLPLEQQRG